MPTDRPQSTHVGASDETSHNLLADAQAYQQCALPTYQRLTYYGSSIVWNTLSGMGLAAVAELYLGQYAAAAGGTAGFFKGIREGSAEIMAEERECMKRYFNK